MTDWKLFGLLVREARRGAGWSQSALGKLAGVNKETINRIELGRNSRASTISAIITALQSERDGHYWKDAIKRLGAKTDDVAVWNNIAGQRPAKATGESSDTGTGISDQGSSEADGESSMRIKEDPSELDVLVATFARLPRKAKNAVMTFLHDQAAAQTRGGHHARAKKARG